MFDLEKSITEWRQQMLTGGIKSPVPLEELEIHLREDIARRVRSGVDEQEAFSLSMQQIGGPKNLRNEFKKCEGIFMKPKFVILVGIFAVLIGTAMILPALHKYIEERAMVHNAAVGFLWGIPITLLGVSATFYGFVKRKA